MTDLTDPRAGQLPEPDELVDVSRLLAALWAYYEVCSFRPARRMVSSAEAPVPGR